VYCVTLSETYIGPIFRHASLWLRAMASAMTRRRALQSVFPRAVSAAQFYAIFPVAPVSRVALEVPHARGAWVVPWYVRHWRWK
jgi:hypothetical protein